MKANVEFQGLLGAAVVDAGCSPAPWSWDLEDTIGA
jgi:hypothetical protein